MFVFLPPAAISMYLSSLPYNNMNKNAPVLTNTQIHAINSLKDTAYKAKLLFDKYAQHHNQKGDLEKRDVNINISDEIRSAINGLDAAFGDSINFTEDKEDKIPMIEVIRNQRKGLIREVIQELENTRRRNEVLEAKVSTFEACQKMLGANVPSFGMTMGVDPVWSLKKNLEEEEKYIQCQKEKDVEIDKFIK